MVEAQVVNILDAAAAGNKGLLHPLLLRHQAKGCPATVFALPAVQVRINHFKEHFSRCKGRLRQFAFLFLLSQV